LPFTTEKEETSKIKLRFIFWVEFLFVILGGKKTIFLKSPVLLEIYGIQNYLSKHLHSFRNNYLSQPIEEKMELVAFAHVSPTYGKV